MVDNLTWWGAGLRNDEYYLFGQTVRIHSNLAYGMAKYGLFIVIFYVFYFFYFIKLLLRHFNFDVKKYRGEKEYLIIRFAVIIHLIIFIISGWASGNSIFDIIRKFTCLFFYYLPYSG